jgi:glycosyltransferase involved in cell wall biosynthesis
LASDRVDMYLANSNHVSKRINKYYHKKAEILYPPVETGRFKAQKSHDDYFLIVAALTPFKKIDLAVHLFNKIGKKLIVIGGGNQLDYLKSIASPNVEIKGYLPDSEVKNYLQNCRAFIMCNEEDFGIAPVEAMACGKPVLAYGKGGTLETVIPGVTGEFFYEQTLQAMEDAIGRLIINEANYKASTIRNHALNFSKQKFIEGIEKAVSQLTNTRF